MRAAGGGDGGRAIVLLSGGIDSAVALWWARARYRDIVCLTFDYHERPRAEARAAQALADAAGARRLLRVDLPFLKEAADLPASLRLNPALAGAPEGYVPARNLVFYSLAAYHAEALGARVLVGGHHGVDAGVFPDASPEFFAAFESLAARGVWSFRTDPLRVELPLARLTKRAVLDLAADLAAPLALTWSCYGDGENPCGRCASCGERRAAFRSVGREDPAPRALAGPV